MRWKWSPTFLHFMLLTVCICSSSYTFATPYNVSGLFRGIESTEVYGTLSIDDSLRYINDHSSFSPLTIETAWQSYLSTATQDNFSLELEYQITSFELYRVDTGESFFHGESGSIEVIVTGNHGDLMPNATYYNAWSLQGAGSVYVAYSEREDHDVIFSNNGINATAFDYDQLPQMIQLSQGLYNDDIFGTAVNLTLTAATPIPEPNTMLLFGIGAVLLRTTKKHLSTTPRAMSK